MKTENSDDGDEITTELFQVLAYQSGLKLDDLQLMTVGMVLDYIQEYIEMNDPKKEKKKRTRKATQNDFDAFAF